MSDLRIRSATAARAQAASVVCGECMDWTLVQAGPNVAELRVPKICAAELPRIRGVDATVSSGGFTHG